MEQAEGERVVAIDGSEIELGRIGSRDTGRVENEYIGGESTAALLGLLEINGDPG